VGDAVLALDRVPADDFGFTLGLRDAVGGIDSCGWGSAVT
jgi:hypothetical protein